MTQYWLQLFLIVIWKDSGCVSRKRRQSNCLKTSPPPPSCHSITQPNHFPSDYTASTVVIKNAIFRRFELDFLNWSMIHLLRLLLRTGRGKDLFKQIKQNMAYVNIVKWVWDIWKPGKGDCWGQNVSFKEKGTILKYVLLFFGFFSFVSEGTQLLSRMARSILCSSSSRMGSYQTCHRPKRPSWMWVRPLKEDKCPSPTGGVPFCSTSFLFRLHPNWSAQLTIDSNGVLH